MKDFLLVSIIGFLVGWLVLPVAVNFDFKITPFFIFCSVVGFTILAPLILAIIYYFSRFWKGLRAFGKFCAVGTLNTLINFSILNLLMYFTGITKGVYYSLFIAVAFLVAVVNSYFWNKFWSFQSQTSTSLSEFSRFLLITIVGLVIDNGVASFSVNLIGPIGGVSLITWANISALFGVAASFLWNFLCYRYIIFKKS